ncbi:MAG: DNA repair protein RecO [Deltaproteobacteria bacterium]|nr:DNA repair protein RecO [Deltaproteobacteria bacterium]
MPSAGPRAFRTSRAFLVRSMDAGETDRRLSFFTEAEGLVPMVAKAARRSRKRFGGVLQKYFLLDVSWTEAPARMAVLGSAAILESFWEIVADWERVRYADYLLELSAALFPQPGPKPKAFEMLLAGMRSLSLGEAAAASGRKAEAAFLAMGGWGPNLASCRACGRPAARSLRQAGVVPGKTGGAAFRFLPSEGGILCADCSGKAGIPLSLGAVKTWRALQSSSPAVVGRVRITDTILDELCMVIPKYIEYNLGRPLRSLGGHPSFRKG